MMDSHNSAIPDFNYTDYLYNCETLTHLTFKSGYIWFSIAKIIISFAAEPLIIYMLITKKFLMYNEVNPLIFFNIAILFFHGLNFAVSTSFQIVELVIYTDPCDRIQYTPRCAYFKAVNYSTTFAISASMLFLALDTGLSLWLSRQWTVLQNIFSKCFFGTLLISTFWILISLYTVDIRGNHLHIHCFDDSAMTRPYAQLLQIIQISMDALTCGLSVLLCLYCRRELQKKHSNLNRTFLIRHSYTILKAFFPLTLYHTGTLAFYNIANFIIRLTKGQMDLVTIKDWQSFANLIPYYVFVAPLFLMVIMKKLKKNRNNEIDHSMRPRFNGKVVPEANVYFEMLRKTWLPEESGRKSVSY